MDGTLHDRDFHAWTQERAAALRRLAETRPNLAEGPGLPAACPATLDALPDEDAPLDQLPARLTPEAPDHA